LPQVSFIITEGNVSEHPPQSILLGQQKMAQVANALIGSSAWTSSALFFTYDEGGGLPSPDMLMSYLSIRAILVPIAAQMFPNTSIRMIPWIQTPELFFGSFD